MPMQGEQKDLSIADYPQLEGAAEGQKISGTWTATVQSSDGQMVNIIYDDFVIDDVNRADQSLNKLTGRNTQAKVAAPGRDAEEV